MRIKKRDILFFIAVYIIMIRMVLICTVFCELKPITQNIMQIVAIILLIIKILWTGLKRKEAIVKGIIAIYLFINYVICGESSLLISYFIIIAAKDMDVNKIVKGIVIPLTFFILTCVGIYFINYFLDNESLNVIIRKTQETSVMRYTFFYKHPNTFAEHVCWVIFMWLYLKLEKINILTYISIGIVAVFLYIFPNSRTNVIILILFIVIYKVCMKYDNKFIRFLRKNIFNICLIISMLLLVFYDENNIIFKYIDSFLSGRIELGAMTNKLFGLTVFGQILPIGGNVEITQYEWIMNYAVDNVYYRLLYSYGIVTFFLYIKFSNKLLFFLDSKDMKRELIFVAMLSIFGISEIVGVNIILAFPLLFINKIYENKERFDEKSINSNTNI